MLVVDEEVARAFLLLKTLVYFLSLLLEHSLFSCFNFQKTRKEAEKEAKTWEGGLDF